MVFYGLKTCDTCRKALKVMRENGDEPTVVDVREDGVPQTVLERGLDKFGEKMINRRSATWRTLSETQRKDAPLDLLKSYPTLMKRPLIDLKGDLFLGWDGAVQKAVL